MAPHSPIPGLPLAYESRAPPQPEAFSRPYTHLLASNGPTAVQADKRGTLYTPHLPGRPHSLTPSRSRSTLSGLPTVLFALLLVMLIAVSSAMYEYDARDQSVVDVVKTAYFERNVYIASGLMMEKRQKGAGIPVSADSPSSSASTVAPSATSSAAKPAKSTFHDDDADDVRDPSAVKPDSGENKQAADADPSDDAQSDSAAAAAAPTARKRHWNSRGPRHGRGRRAFWY